MSEKLKPCDECGKNISINAHQCPKCGFKSQVKCQICHSNIPSDSKICPECGDPKPIEKYPKISTQKIGGKISSVAKSNSVKVTLKIFLILIVSFTGLIVFGLLREIGVRGAIPSAILVGVFFLIIRFIWRFNNHQEEELSTQKKS